MSNLNIYTMKSLKILAIAIALFAMNVSTSTASPVNPNTKLRAELMELIGKNCPVQLTKDQCTAEVLFMINEKSEIVVISVNSENEDAEDYIKDKLNYHKISPNVSRAGEIYLLPLRIQKES